MSCEERFEVVYGYVRLETVWRPLPDGSIEFGCRRLAYDNRPSEPERLASNVTTWGTMRMYFE